LSVLLFILIVLFPCVVFFFFLVCTNFLQVVSMTGISCLVPSRWAVWVFCEVIFSSLFPCANRASRCASFFGLFFFFALARPGHSHAPSYQVPVARIRFFSFEAVQGALIPPFPPFLQWPFFLGGVTCRRGQGLVICV